MFVFKSKYRRSDDSNAWPCFVDVLSTVLVIFVFVFMAFFMSHIYLADTLFKKKSEEVLLKNKITVLEKDNEKITRSEEEKANLARKIKDLNSLVDKSKLSESDLQAQIIALKSELDNKNILYNDIKLKLDSLSEESKNAKSVQEKYEELQKQVSKQESVGEIRSRFFSELKKILENEQGVVISGDRFILPSGVFFDDASAEVKEDAKDSLKRIADVLKGVISKAPEDLQIVLRVDGHTDSRGISTQKYPSNWELSAARSISVIKILAEQGIPYKNLLAAGFAEFQPLTTGNTAEDWKKNRRIEFKLDQK